MTANDLTYSSKATAKRGAIRLGLSDEQYELIEREGRWAIELAGVLWDDSEAVTAHRCTFVGWPVGAAEVARINFERADAMMSRNAEPALLCAIFGEEPDASAIRFRVARAVRESAWNRLRTLAGRGNVRARRVLAGEQLVPLVVSATASPCRKVRLIADSMLHERRKDIIAKCIAKGVSPNTAKTQYQLWFVATSGGHHTYYEYDEQGNVLGKWGEVD